MFIQKKNALENAKMTALFSVLNILLYQSSLIWAKCAKIIRKYNASIYINSSDLVVCSHC